MTRVPSLLSLRRARHLAARRNRPGHPEPGALRVALAQLGLVVLCVVAVAVIA